MVNEVIGMLALSSILLVIILVVLLLVLIFSPPKNDNHSSSKVREDLGKIKEQINGDDE